MIKFKGFSLGKKRVFLDYASTAPLLKEVFLAMKPFLTSHFANPSALYKDGLFAKKVVSDSRTSVARILGCRAQEIIFTSGGTESNNMAILGLFEKYKKQFIPHIITSAIEHPAVLEVCREVERRGGKVSYVKVDENGLINPKDVFSLITSQTILVSVMLANNEIGTIEPIANISRAIKKYREEKNTVLPYFHTDACQAINYISANINSLGVDLMTLDGGKIYGPKGTGLLFVKRGIDLSPIIFGGGQEIGLRPGTENVSGIVGITKALFCADRDQESESKRLMPLRDYFISKALQISPKITLNGDVKNRLPNNINICILGIDSEFAVIGFDLKGVACSAGSSCNVLKEISSSYVIESLNKKECAGSSLRFTLGRHTNKSDINKALMILSKIVAQ